MSTELLTFIFEGNIVILVVAIAVLFSAATILLMINDYRLHIEDNWEDDASFVGFLKQEQFFIYLLLFFVLVVVVELWMHELMFM